MEENFFDEEVVSEAPEYSPKSEFSKPKLVELAVQKCIELRGKEMRRGYFNIQKDKDGQEVKTWVTDTRKEYISSVEALQSLLAPECRRDENYSKHYSEFNNMKKKIFNKFAYTQWKMKNPIPGQRVSFEKTEIKYMPNIDDAVYMPIVNNSGRTQIQRVPGGWNPQIHAYYEALLNLYDQLFARLNEVIDRLNYFKVGAQF